ncbi:inhibitor of cysteine peptidase [Mycolicibacterium sp. BK634]|uniref:protease inhibitor I42 family protein n=1 Tax=Mycolicibacterium sp. BK634 TaxID=2587099 RepID=UPI001607F867|nr:protease inhibitor I42 family protein [Mycolicibacterium sp. BK634]MBB3748084.1 inhibitor of cysteine peptidase [Mycolicibacterium sp. BK634]
MIRLIAVLALALALTGCGGIKKPPGTTTIDVAYDDLLNKKHLKLDISLGVGDTLRLVLASNPSTGYQWAPQAQISDPAVIAQRDHFDSGPSGVHLPGAPGTTTWTFQALKAGAATVATTYSQPWPGGVKDSWSFTAAVTIR